MIDAEKCTFEEMFNTDEGETVYYFIYPAEAGMNETEFITDKNEADIVGTCLSLTVYDGGCYIQLSPSILKDEMISDVEFRDLYPGVNYTEDTVAQLIAKANFNAFGNQNPNYECNRRKK